MVFSVVFQVFTFSLEAAHAQSSCPELAPAFFSQPAPSSEGFYLEAVPHSATPSVKQFCPAHCKQRNQHTEIFKYL